MTSIYHQSKEAAAEARLARLDEFADAGAESGKQFKRYKYPYKDYSTNHNSGGSTIGEYINFLRAQNGLPAIPFHGSTHGSQSGTDPVI